MRRLLFHMFFSICTIAMINAQNDIEPMNAGAANFLTIDSDARIVAMGGSSVALINSNPAFFNGATSLFGEVGQMGFVYNFSPIMRDYESGHNFYSFGGYRNNNDRNAIYAGLKYYNYPKVVLVDSEGIYKNSIRPKEWAIDIGYSYRILESLAVATTFRFVNSDMGNNNGAKSANAIAFDISAFYLNDLNTINEAKWSVGIKFSNIGTKLKYLTQKESLPLLGELGGAVYLPLSQFHLVIVTTDIAYRFTPDDIRSVNISSGIEYTLKNLVSLRGGYHYGDKVKGQWSYSTAGLGISVYKVKIDFAWIFSEKGCPLNKTFSISCGVNL